MDQAVILARGLGTRMRKPEEGVELSGEQQAAADSGQKAMIRFGRPFLDYVLADLADAGYRRVCLVIGPEHEEIRNYYGSLETARLAIDFAIQQEPRGTADAVAAAERFAGNDHFLVINSDNLYPREALTALRELPGAGLALFEQESLIAGGNFTRERVSRFAVGKIDSRGLLERIIEKPDEAALAAMPRPVYLSMNCWRFGPAIFQGCKAISPSPRGEYEVTDAVQYAIDVLGEKMHVAKISAPVLDLTSRGDIAAMAARLAGKDVNL
ncbi:MAG: nucleotidyltransferase family protein [Pirellulales bacterium]|nr:nucleotidyltransferase family protein [Pirellulales bacterium]